MSKANLLLPNGPFLSKKTYSGKDGFDKYYLDVTEKQVFIDSGEVDSETGQKLGVIENRYIIKKIDIDEYIGAQADSVGVDAYIRQLALQGENIDSYSTAVGDHVQDFSNMPDNLADVMLAGDNARKAFANMDPALKGDHTTIEGFLNSLTKENVEAYIKGVIEAQMPKKVEGE